MDISASTNKITIYKVVDDLYIQTNDFTLYDLINKFNSEEDIKIELIQKTYLTESEIIALKYADICGYKSIKIDRICKDYQGTIEYVAFVYDNINNYRTKELLIPFCSLPVGKYDIKKLLENIDEKEENTND